MVETAFLGTRKLFNDCTLRDALVKLSVETMIYVETSRDTVDTTKQHQTKLSFT